MRADCETNPINPLFSVLLIQKGLWGSEGQLAERSIPTLVLGPRAGLYATKIRYLGLKQVAIELMLADDLAKPVANPRPPFAIGTQTTQPQTQVSWSDYASNRTFRE